jgi:hypothetical protein
MSATKPISVGSYLFDVFAGTLTGYGLVAIYGVARGDLIAGFVAIAAPIFVPLFWILSSTIGSAPFILLRDSAPANVLGRFAFITAFLAPIVFFLCVLGGLWIDGLSGYSPYFHSPKPPLAARLEEALTENWRVMLFVTLIGGVACWGFDQRSCLASEDRSARVKARLLLAGGLSAFILPIVMIMTCNQFLVEHRAKRIAGERPYCILVPSYDSQEYETATRTSQLSFAKMRAASVGVHWGLMFVTSHSLLVLDNPREYLNWSYRSEDFVHDALINLWHGVKNGR